MLRRPPAIGFDVCTLHDAQAAGAQYAVLRDLESGSLYRAPIETIFRYGFPPKAERVADTNQERLDLQLELFEVGK